MQFRFMPGYETKSVFVTVTGEMLSIKGKFSFNYICSLGESF